MTKKEKFKDWMKTIDKRDESTCNLYSRQIDLITNDLKNNGEIKNGIYSINDSKKMEDIISIFYSDDNRKKQNGIGHNLKSSSLKKYKQFLQFLEKGENLKYDLYVDENKIDNEIVNIEHDLDKVETTERLSIIKSRIGQTEYRQGLLGKYKKCQLCGIDIQELLVASHIKPWSESTDKEKLDLNNGLLLCCIHDKLFDIGLISFNESGEIIISNKISKSLFNDLNLINYNKIDINYKTKKYLNWHMKNKFIK